jgi:N-glycosylase/DNA lyase
MLRVLIGILLLGIGVYSAWEANSILNSWLFQFAAIGGHADKITPSDLQVLNSFVADALAKVGADTWGEMQRYLSVVRVGGIVIAIFGGLVALSGLRRGS